MFKIIFPVEYSLILSVNGQQKYFIALSKSTIDFQSESIWQLLGGTVVRRRAHNPRVVCSIPALATFEDSILGQGVNTNCASLHPGV